MADEDEVVWEEDEVVGEEAEVVWDVVFELAGGVDAAWFELPQPETANVAKAAAAITTLGRALRERRDVIETNVVSPFGDYRGISG